MSSRMGGLWSAREGPYVNLASPVQSSGQISALVKAGQTFISRLCFNIRKIFPPGGTVPHSSNAFARIAAIACLLGATILLSACPPRRSIESINRDPDGFPDHEVTIA